MQARLFADLQFAQRRPRDIDDLQLDLRVLAETAARSPGKIRPERFPSLAEILGHVHERIVIVRAMAVENDVGPPLDEMRRLDRGDPSRAGESDVLVDLRPVLAAVAGDP